MAVGQNLQHRSYFLKCPGGNAFCSLGLGHENFFFWMQRSIIAPQAKGVNTPMPDRRILLSQPCATTQRTGCEPPAPGPTGGKTAIDLLTYPGDDSRGRWTERALAVILVAVKPRGGWGVRNEGLSCGTWEARLAPTSGNDPAQRPILRPCAGWTESERSDLTRGAGLARSWGCARRNRDK